MTSAKLAFVSLGSNIEPEAHLPRAVSELRRLGTLRGVSTAYQDLAVGPAGQPDFVNAAVLLETTLPASELRQGLRVIEAALGRVRTPDRYAPRTIDLDLCLIGSDIVVEEGWRLPDPDLLTRVYLAQTMADLAPGFQHPQTGETLQQIALRLREGTTLKTRPDVTAQMIAAMKGG